MEPARSQRSALPGSSAAGTSRLVRGGGAVAAAVWTAAAAAAVLLFPTSIRGTDAAAYRAASHALDLAPDSRAVAGPDSALEALAFFDAIPGRLSLE